jgi:hypothetical protein
VQARQEVPEFALLVLHALERLGAVSIEGAVGTRDGVPVPDNQPSRRLMSGDLGLNYLPARDLSLLLQDRGAEP